MTAMYILDNNDKSISTDTDAYCEAVACQEEIYLEETEEEVHMILESYDPPSSHSENCNEQREHAVEELITGDSDDPPLSEELVDEMLDSFEHESSA
jgi:hypothetical protein